MKILNIYIRIYLKKKKTIEHCPFSKGSAPQKSKLCLWRAANPFSTSDEWLPWSPEVTICHGKNMGKSSNNCENSKKNGEHTHFSCKAHWTSLSIYIYIHQWRLDCQSEGKLVVPKQPEFDQREKWQQKTNNKPTTAGHL